MSFIIAAIILGILACLAFKFSWKCVMRLKDEGRNSDDCYTDMMETYSQLSMLGGILLSIVVTILFIRGIFGVFG